MKALACEDGGGGPSPPFASLPTGGLHHALLPTPRRCPILRRRGPARQVPLRREAHEEMRRRDTAAHAFQVADDFRPASRVSTSVNAPLRGTPESGGQNPCNQVKRGPRVLVQHAGLGLIVGQWVGVPWAVVHGDVAWMELQIRPPAAPWLLGQVGGPTARHGERSGTPLATATLLRAASR